MKTEESENKPRLLRIQLDYEDGSRDDIEVLSGGSSELPLYGWKRERPDERMPAGAYTRGAIAVILFNTVLEQRLTEYNVADPKIRELFSNVEALSKERS